MWFIEFLAYLDINLSTAETKNEWIYIPKEKEEKPNVKMVDGIVFIGLIPEND